LLLEEDVLKAALVNRFAHLNSHRSAASVMLSVSSALRNAALLFLGYVRALASRQRPSRNGHSSVLVE
jgi:hypothetical protein